MGLSKTLGPALYVRGAAATGKGGEMVDGCCDPYRQILSLRVGDAACSFHIESGEGNYFIYSELFVPPRVSMPRMHGRFAVWTPGQSVAEVILLSNA
jgi:hypothetical protein